MESSLWDEPDYVVKIFLTMMAVKDADHVVRFTAYQISRKARKTEREVLDALKILSEPDTKRLERQPFEGRRIKKVEDGWLIINGEKYRAMVRDEMRKARNRRAQAAYRARKRGSLASGPLAGENEYVAKSNAGAGETELDEVVNRHLPRERPGEA